MPALQTDTRWLLFARGFEPPHGCSVNPNRLFNYLEGKLSQQEREAVEEELMNSPDARREFEIARRIRGASHGGVEKFEIVGGEPDDSARGRRIARQVMLAALVLVAMNVFLGLLYIARHESKNPNRALLEKQNREHVQQALDKAAASSLTPPPLGVAELKVAVEPGKIDATADEITQLATRLGGSATKGLPDDGRVEVLAEIADQRAFEFRDAIVNLGGTKVSGTIPPPANAAESVSVVVQITEAK